MLGTTAALATFGTFSIGALWAVFTLWTLTALGAFTLFAVTACTALTAGGWLNASLFQLGQLLFAQGLSGFAQGGAFVFKAFQHGTGFLAGQTFEGLVDLCAQFCPGGAKGRDFGA